MCVDCNKRFECLKDELTKEVEKDYNVTSFISTFALSGERQGAKVRLYKFCLELKSNYCDALDMARRLYSLTLGYDFKCKSVFTTHADTTRPEIELAIYEKEETR